MPNLNLSGRTILITGAAHGLGRELAILLDGLGALLVLADRDAAGLADLPGRLTRPQQTIACDLATLAGRHDLIDAIQSQGGVDILINCAGIGSHSRLAQLEVDEVEALLQVNSLAPLELMAGLSPLDLIVNIGSVAGEMSLPSMSLYAASKACLHAFTRSIHMEGARTLLVILGPMRGTDFVSSIRHPHTGQPGWYRDLDLDARTAAQEIIRAMQGKRQQLVLPRWYPIVFSLARLVVPFMKHLGTDRDSPRK